MRGALRILGLALLIGLFTGLAACKPGLCLGGDPACTIPSPCADLAFVCEGGEVAAPTVKVFEVGDPMPGGLDALLAPGDFVLRSDRVLAVIDALDHPHYLAPSGGTLLDLAPITAAGVGADNLNQVIHAVGLLPDDAAVYTKARMIEGEGYVALQVSGHLDGHPDLRIATRYELRACEPGLRVRTEFANLEPDPKVITLLDGFYWSGRELLPFTPVMGTGFVHPSFGLTTVSDVTRDTPFVVATSHTAEASSYAVLACDAPALSGFQSDVVSAVGKRPTLLPTRSVITHERFIGVVPGRSVGPAADLALDVREQLFDERWVRVEGQVEAAGGPLGDEARASVRLEAGALESPAAIRVPWTQIVPDAEGRFAVRVPWKRDYVLAVDAFGRPVAEQAVKVGIVNVDVGVIAIPGDGQVTLELRRDGAPGEGLVFFHPADDETAAAVTGKLHGAFSTCAPLLGSPVGGSPACNRVLVIGSRSVAVPAGHYLVYATAGPFRTLGRREITVVAGEAKTLSFDLDLLPLQPAGTLSADLHVHGGASFDSSIPHADRVEAFLAADLQVIVATDHDVVWDYAAARAASGADARLALIVGVETTGHVLYGLDPTSSIPKVIGHWNFWPLTYDPLGTRRGMPWDERAEPGELMQRMVDSGWPDDRGVVELNHPFAEADFGRDLGWPRAIGVNLEIPLPAQDDGSGPGLFFKTPATSRFSNADYHAQEVMNGTKNGDLLAYRAFWFYLLNQGILRTGTANSDSHGLTDNVLGTPRNLVRANTPVQPFTEAVFDAALREGRVLGTNGPVIEASLASGGRPGVGPALAAIQPAADAALTIKVSAAPWVPVRQVRVLVNGAVVQRFEGGDLVMPTDPLGTGELVRIDRSLPLSDLLPGDGRDAWIVIEAGDPLPPFADLDCDGVIDEHDLDRSGDGKVDAKDRPEACKGGTGPLRGLPLPEDRSDPARIFEAVTPGGYPFAFTNPFIIDRAGDGFDAPGLPRDPAGA